MKKSQDTPISKKLMLEAVFYSFYYEFSLRFGVGSAVTSLHKNEEEAKEDEADVGVLRQVSRTLEICRKKLPWHPKCYNRALTGKKLLKNRGIESQIHVGFRKTNGKFDGHAWLTYNKKFITGRVPNIRMFNELQSLSGRPLYGNKNASIKKDV